MGLKIGNVLAGSFAANGGTKQAFANAVALYASYQLTEQIKLADELGYDSVSFTEHHFHIEGFEVSNNPVLLDLYFAMQTKRIKVGQLGIVLPAANPIRVAEDIAMLDHMTGGRAVAGFAAVVWLELVASGASPRTLGIVILGYGGYTLAMMAQFGAVETLRPPNFMTTHGESGYGVSTAWLTPRAGTADICCLWKPSRDSNR